MDRATCRATACLAICAVAAGAWADGSSRYAIRAGKIVTVTQGTINHGVVLVSEGVIEAVGAQADIDIPAGYAVIDATDRWVMPGMIEVHSHCGVQGGLNDMVAQTNPGMRIGDGVDPDSEIVRVALSAGVTTIQTLPGSGTNHAGFGCAFKTAGATKEDRIIRRVSCMKIAQADNPERRAGDVGATRMGMSWILREHLDRAKAYDAAWRASEAGETDAPPERDIALEQARSVFSGGLPVYVHTWQTWGMTMTARMFHDEYDLAVIATHATGAGHRTADQVAKRAIPVNVGPRVVDFYGVGDGRFHGIAAEYDAAGVQSVSVNTDSFNFGQTYLAVKAAMAARFGMDDASALRSVTIEPARALLLADRLGSIEVGKDADLIIKQTNVTDPTTPVEMVFVDGELAYEYETRG